MKARIYFLILSLILSTPIAAAKEADLLFRSDELMQITLTGPIRRLSKDRDSSLKYGPADLAYEDANGNLVSLNVKLRSRGNKRLHRTTCSFPPIRVLFDKKETRGTVFSRQKKLKLVTQCHPEDSIYESYIITEYMAYKILNLLTENSFLVRLARVTYVERNSGKTLNTTYGFFIEPNKRLARRIDRKRLRPAETSAARLDSEHLNLVSLFQMMLGNTDWSATHGGGDDDCCHNGKLFGEEEAMDNLYIPYDFDMTGLVDPEYATIDKALKLDSIRERRYRGYCRNDGMLAGNIALLNSKKSEILSLFQDSPYLRDAWKPRKIRYIEKFYRLINNPKRVKSKINGWCHKSFYVEKAAAEIKP
jgi:hypothetical protein